jgi:ubiquinone/menaquinone biosynthesis C-methylase UbiE
MDKVFKHENLHKLESDDRKKLVPPESVLNLMEIKQGDILLDIGSGPGYFAIPAANYVGIKGKVIAADLSLQMLDELKKRVPANIQNMEIILCSSDNVSLPEKIADKILLAFVFHEIDNQVDYLKNLKKLLKENGTITIVEWDKTESPIGPPLHERLNIDDITAIAKGAGYSVVKYHKINELQYLCVLK